MSRINPTVSDLLRANMLVSDQRLQSELRSLTRAIRYYGTQAVYELMGLYSPTLGTISPKKLMRLEEERGMVLQAINNRLALLLEATHRDSRAYTDIPGSWSSSA